MNTAITSEAATATTPAAGPGTRRPHRALDDVFDGVRAMLPWLVGVVPFGMVVGMTARTSDVDLGAGLLTGATIYSGSAQLTAIGLLSEGAGVVVIVASVLVINARLLLYGSSIGPHWKGTGVGYRAWAAYLLVDPSYVVGMRRYEDGSARAGSPHVHYLAAGVTLWIAWHAAMVTGAVVGSGLPGWLPLHYAVPLFLLAEVVQVVRTGPALTAAVVAGTVAVAGTNVPLHGGLLIAVVAGVGGAAAADRRSR